MNFSDYLFYIVSSILIIAAASAVFSVKIKSALSFASVALTFITAVFFFLGTDYIALLYFLFFVIGALGITVFAHLKSAGTGGTIERGGSLISIIICAVFSALLMGALISGKWQEIAPVKPGLSAEEITGLINSEYLLPLFITFIILFVGIIGAAYKMRKTE